MTPFFKMYFAFWVLFAPRGAFIHHRRESLLVARSPLAVVHRLRCSGVCRILALRPGIELASAALQGRLVTAGPAGKSRSFLPVSFPDFSNEFPVYKSSSDRKTQHSNTAHPLKRPPRLEANLLAGFRAQTSTALRDRNPEI